MFIRKKTDDEDKSDVEKKKKRRNSESDTEEEEENKRVDIEYATKNKDSKKKRGKGRKDLLIVKTITITKRKRKRYQCTQKGCTEVFEDVKMWVKHLENEHKLEKYSCSICGHKTKSKQKYDQHMMKHDEKKNKWKCTVCAKTFRHRCYLTRHELNHTNERKYECTDPRCREKESGKFKRKADFIRHMEKHSGKRFVCTVCGSEWPSKKDRYEHERSVHRPLKECKNKNSPVKG